ADRTSTAPAASSRPRSSSPTTIARTARRVWRASRRSPRPPTEDSGMQIRFAPVRFREGYDIQEVDDLLDRCERALRSGDGSVTAETVQQLRLTPTRFGEGYDMEDVDRFLDGVLLPLLASPERFPYDRDRDYTGADLLREARAREKQQRVTE